MALSGSFYTNVGAGWRLQLEWSGTQSVADNTTTITAKLYWMSLGSSYTVSSSATKDASVYIDGTWNGKSEAGLASLSGNQKKLIHTYTKVVNHNSDGTKSATLDGWFDAEVTLSGVYYGRINLAAKTYTLNTIPRASTLTSSPSWTAGSSLPITISRASSDFSHDVIIKVNGRTIRTLSGIGTSTTVSFSNTENQWIFEELAKDTVNYNQATSIQVITKKSGSEIGTNTYNGTASSPSRSTTSWGGDFSIGDSLNGNITKSLDNFTHTIQLVFDGTVYTLHSKITQTSWTFDSSAIAQSLYAQTPNSNTLSGYIRMYTYYEGVQVRNYAQSDISAFVVNSYPTFTGDYSYKDTNSETLAITGDETKIIQNKSTVLVTIPVSARAEAQNEATMKQYIATLGGKQRTATYSGTSDVTFDFGVFNSKEDLSLSIKAVDSRGNWINRIKTVSIIPYFLPTLNVTAKRTNGFERSTTLTMNGEISPINVNGVNKNLIESVQYRYRDTTVGTAPTWDTWTDFTYSVNGNEYDANEVVLDLDNTASFYIEFKITDQLNNVNKLITLSTGKPLLFIDSQKKAVGVNKFPDNSNCLEVNGDIFLDGDIYKDGVLFEAGTDTSNGLVFDETVSRAIEIVTKDNDVDIFRVGNSGSGYGYYQKYTGTGSANDNNLELWTEGEIGTDVLAMKVWQDGTVLFPKGINVEDEGGKHRTVLKGIGDDVNNYGIATLLQGGGQTIVGGGEGGANWFAGEGDPANEHIILASDHDTKIATDMQSGYATRREWIFARNGYLYHPRYKMSNGYNMNTIRDSSDAHDDLLLIQNVVGTASFSGESFTFVDVTFPVTFNSAPLWIVATAINSSSYGYNAAVYNPSTSGCRIYLRHIQDASITGTIQVQVVTCGKRA